MHRGFRLGLLLVLVAGMVPTLSQAALRDSRQSDDATFANVMSLAIGSADEPGDIDTFWREAFDAMEPGFAYEPPDFHTPYDADHLPTSACFPDAQAATRLDNAFYCPDDGTNGMLGWDHTWLGGLFEEVGAFAPLAIIAHEWGHHVQDLMGKAVTGLRAELQADCLAAVYLFDAVDRQITTDLEFAQGALSLLQSGNPGYKRSEWFNPGEHGSPALRMQALYAGSSTSLVNELARLEDSSAPVDLAYCRDYDVFKPAPSVNVGSYAINPHPATSIDAHGNGSVNFEHSAGNARFFEMPDIVAGSAKFHFDTARDAYFADPMFALNSLRLIDEPFATSLSDMLGGGSTMSQYYELTTTNAGQTGELHGIVTLHVLPGAGSMIVDVFRSGSAPSDGDWRGVLAHWYSVLAGVCAPGQDAFITCLFSDLGLLDIPEVTIRASNEGIDMPRRVNAGPTLVTFVNVDIDPWIANAFMLVKLTNDLNLRPTLPPEEAPSGRIGATPEWVYDATLLGGPFIGFARQAQVVVDLTPGQWVVVGYPLMTPISPAFTVAEAEPGKSPALEIGAEITFDDEGFEGLDELEPGHQIWRLSNAGLEPHELLVHRFPNGTTMDQINAWYAFWSSPPDTEPPDDLGFDPFDDVSLITATAALSNGQSSLIEITNLPPGTYAAYCAFPDLATELFHAELGEIERFEVGHVTE